jgi:hypothetical protein
MAPSTPSTASSLTLSPSLLARTRARKSPIYRLFDTLSERRQGWKYPNLLEHAQKKIRDAPLSHRGATLVHPVTRASRNAARSVERPDAPEHFSRPAKKSPHGLRFQSREPVASLPTTPVSSATTSRALTTASGDSSASPTLKAATMSSLASLSAANQQTGHASITLDGKEEPSDVKMMSPMSKAGDNYVAVSGAPAPSSGVTVSSNASASKAAAASTVAKSAPVGSVLVSATSLSRQVDCAKQSSTTWSRSSQKKSLSESSAFDSPTRELAPYEQRSESPDSVDEEKKGDTSSSIRLQSERMEHVTNMVVTDPYGDQGSFTGVLIRGKPDSYGTMIYKDGRVYSGSWHRGRWNGHGHVIFANGDTYTGDYVRDQRHGVGRYEWSDGRVYDGRFERDQRHGHGIYSWPDDSMYSGEFYHGVRHGLGTFTYPDGSVYNGTWRDGRQNGHGECVWADGRCFRGDWVDGHARFGVEVRADGTIRHNGLWEHDRPVRKNGRLSDDNKKKSAASTSGAKDQPTCEKPKKLQADACNTTVSKKSRIALQHRDRVANKPSDHKRGGCKSKDAPEGSKLPLVATDSLAAWYTNQLLRSLSPTGESSIALLLNTDSRESSEFDNDSEALEQQCTTEFDYCRQPSSNRQSKRSSRLLRYRLKMKHAAMKQQDVNEQQHGP